MKLARWIVLLVLLVAPAFLVISYTHEFLAVDSALDSGASYDYQTGRADHSQNHPVIPFSARHGLLISTATWSFVAAVIYGFTWYVWRDRKHAA